MPYNTNKPILKYKRPSQRQIFLIRDDQAGMCGICREALSKEPNEVMVDHDHKTNRIRGLLCRRCNIGLGFFKDSIGLLSEAIQYLERTDEKHPSQLDTRSNIGEYHNWRLK